MPPDPTVRVLQLLIAASLAAPGAGRKLLLAELCALPASEVATAAVSVIAQYADEERLRNIILSLAALA